MKRKIASTLVSATGVLASPFIFQACETAESADELNKILESNARNSLDSIGVPIGIPLSVQDQNYVKFLHHLSQEIVRNPFVAKEFSENPDAYCLKYGYSQSLNLDGGLLKLITALGDYEVNDSINKRDVNAFIKACKKNGLLEFNSLNQDPYLKKLSGLIKDYPTSSLARQIDLTRAGIRQEEVNASAVYGVLAIVIAAVAVEAFLFIGTTTWVMHGKAISQNQNNVLEVWDLKKGFETDYMMANQINDEIAQEGIKIIKENFPEVYETVDENTLRNVILLNLSKNTSYEK